MLAADRLENIFWFGLLDDMQRSLELLQYQLQYPNKVSYFKTSRNVGVFLAKTAQNAKNKINYGASIGSIQASVTDAPRRLALQLRKDYF